jgi:hypothetical protein
MKALMHLTITPELLRQASLRFESFPTGDNDHA